MKDILTINIFVDEAPETDTPPIAEPGTASPPVLRDWERCCRRVIRIFSACAERAETAALELDGDAFEAAAVLAEGATLWATAFSENIKATVPGRNVRSEIEIRDAARHRLKELNERSRERQAQISDASMARARISGEIANIKEERRRLVPDRRVGGKAGKAAEDVAARLVAPLQELQAKDQQLVCEMAKLSEEIRGDALNYLSLSREIVRLESSVYSEIFWEIRQRWARWSDRIKQEDRPRATLAALRYLHRHLWDLPSHGAEWLACNQIIERTIREMEAA